MANISVREAEKQTDIITWGKKMFVHLRTASKPYVLTVTAEQIMSGEIELVPTDGCSRALIEVIHRPFSFRVKRLSLSGKDYRKTVDWVKKTARLPEGAKESPIKEIVFNDNDCVFKTGEGPVAIPWNEILTGIHGLQITSFEKGNHVIFPLLGQPIIKVKQPYFNAIADRAREDNIKEEKECSSPT